MLERLKTNGLPTPRKVIEEHFGPIPERALPPVYIPRDSVDPDSILARGRGAIDSAQVRVYDQLHVVVDLDRNELRFMSGVHLLWSAPVGTGTGLMLQSDTTKWEFSTPRGRYEVKFKERDPVWYKPDWYYVKNNLPIPPQDAPERKALGELGPAAVYISEELAIHGTDKPELLGQRVSHGCIRMSNANIVRLYRNVQIGTPVFIVGGEDDPAQSDTASFRPERKPTKRPFTPYIRTTTVAKDSAPSTDDVLMAFDLQRHLAKASSDWALSASELIDRGVGGEATALDGLFARAGAGSSPEFDREFATFLADAYLLAPQGSLAALSRVDPPVRKFAALSVVRALMDQYSGNIDAPTVPWPTRRMPRESLSPLGRVGWDALRDAEGDYRRLTMRSAEAKTSR